MVETYHPHLLSWHLTPQMGPTSSTFFFDVLSVVLIDVLLAGDNAVVIALAVKSLPPKQRRIGIAVGAGGAVVLRIILTFFAAQLLQLQFLKLAGGILILWIAVKLLTDSSDPDPNGRDAHSLRQAIWLILVADITMSVDNILAVAAASKGNLPLLILGLGLSITFVVFTSTLLSKIMDRYPVVIWIGAAILGRVAAEMIVTDPWVVARLHPPELLSIAAQITAAAGVMLVGWALRHRAAKRWKNSVPPRV
jgi:YjbE family integral membrane protein